MCLSKFRETTRQYLTTMEVEVDIYGAAKRRGKYPPLVVIVYTCFSIHKKLIWMISSLITDANLDAMFSRVARK